MTTQLDYPLHFDGRGRTAATTDDEHIRDMIEQLLLTAPGERVNRPTFGSGVLGLVFAPAGMRWPPPRSCPWRPP
jgi:phage baseplate assembly protein W